MPAGRAWRPAHGRGECISRGVSQLFVRGCLANLPALYKAAFFVLQAQAFAASGVYCEDAAALERHLPDADSRAVLAGRGQKAFTPQEAPEHYALLVRWAGAVLRGFGED